MAELLPAPIIEALEEYKATRSRWSVSRSDALEACRDAADVLVAELDDYLGLSGDEDEDQGGDWL